MSRGNRACRTGTRMLATSPQQVVRVGLVEFGERHDTRTNGQRFAPQQTAGRPIRSAAWQAERSSLPTRATSS